MPGSPLWTRTIEAVADGIAAEHAFDRLPIWADSLEDAGWEDMGVVKQPGFGGWAPFLSSISSPLINLRRGGEYAKKTFYEICVIAMTNGWRYEQPGRMYDSDYVPTGILHDMPCPSCGQTVATERLPSGQVVIAFHERVVDRKSSRCPGSENGFVRVVGQWEEIE